MKTFSILSWLAAAAFIGLKIANVITLSWWWILVPLLAPLGVVLGFWVWLFFFIWWESIHGRNPFA